MGLVELLFLAIALSMDAFAVAICIGLTMQKCSLKTTLIIGTYFGIFQAFMPVIGYFCARYFATRIIEYDHWIAFSLLCFLGGKMIFESVKKEKSDDVITADAYIDNECLKNTTMKDDGASIKFGKMLTLALATSIDALAVGVSFAFLHVKIFQAVSFIGLVTFTISISGVKIGNIFGIKFKSKAEFSGGVILVIIGLKILLEHIYT